MTRPSRRVADYAPSTLEFSAELVLAAAVEEAVALLVHARVLSGSLLADGLHHRAESTLLAAATAADLILGRAR